MSSAPVTVTVTVHPPDPSAGLIVCQGCGMPVGRRWADGGLRIFVTSFYVDDRGRFVVICPVCDARVRFAAAQARS